MMTMILGLLDETDASANTVIAKSAARGRGQHQKKQDDDDDNRIQMMHNDDVRMIR